MERVQELSNVSADPAGGDTHSGTGADGRKIGKRMKPALAIYRPGSGPLRRSSAIGDTVPSCELQSDMTKHVSEVFTTAGKKMDVSKKKCKKPSLELYVPKPLAVRLKQQEDEYPKFESDTDSLSVSSNRSKQDKRIPRSGHGSTKDERIQRSKHPLDRVICDTAPNHRSRDWRSVEPMTPNTNRDKEVQTNRRSHSINRNECRLPSNTRSHFTKKREENNRTNIDLSGDNWDGNSITFEGKLKKAENIKTAPMPVGQGVARDNILKVPGRGKCRGRLQRQELDRVPGKLRPEPQICHEPGEDQRPILNIGDIAITKNQNLSISYSAASNIYPDVDDLTISPKMDWSEEVEMEMAKESQHSSSRSSSQTYRNRKISIDKSQKETSVENLAIEEMSLHCNCDHSKNISQHCSCSLRRKSGRKHTDSGSYTKLESTKDVESSSQRKEYVKSDCSSSQECSDHPTDKEDPSDQVGSITDRDKEGKMVDDRAAKSISHAGIIRLAPLSPSESDMTLLQQPNVTTVKRHLFDPNNPGQLIPVMTSGNRSVRSDSVKQESQAEIAALFENYCPYTNYYCHVVPLWSMVGDTPPAWLDPAGERAKEMNSPQLIVDTESTVRELLWFIRNGCLRRDWKHILFLRAVLERLLKRFLLKNLRFCELENVEKYLWTVSTHKLIEKLRELLNSDRLYKNEYKSKMLQLIELDTEFLEGLAFQLEVVYNFKIDDYVTEDVIPPQNTGYVGLALVSIQKLYIFLGDLARYKEEVNQTTNYGKCRQWYLKAQLINPKNGLPYNQLAVIAVLARRKLDAVYYYMRSLMASNPVCTARENLTLLFDEARRKYEFLEKKREEEYPKTDHMKEKESPRGLRREFWIHPREGVPRFHITTSTVPESIREMHQQGEELRQMSTVELNKRFITSYNNVHGKLFSKVGMETFRKTAVCMLLEFRTLLQHEPLPLTQHRFLQLTAINIFSIHNTQLRGREDDDYRSALQENALIVAFQMVNLMLERSIALLKRQMEEYPEGTYPRYIVPEDMQTLLPSLRVWYEWMLRHIPIWNPIPSCADFRVGPPEDVRERIAQLLNLLLPLNLAENPSISHSEEGRALIYPTEQRALSDFEPMRVNRIHLAKFYARIEDMGVGLVAVRLILIQTISQHFLVKTTPAIIKLHEGSNGRTEYVGVSEAPEHLLQSSSDICLESLSEDEEVVDVTDEEASRRHTILCEALTTSEGGETLTLLRRKAELERDLDRHKIIVQEVLKISQVEVEIDVKPRILVPDTNTFIDHMQALTDILEMRNDQDFMFSFGVPLVVFRELEGLSLGSRAGASVPSDKLEHISIVAEAARKALTFLRSKHPRVRCYTTRGTMINISSCVMYEYNDEFTCNDDRILETALSLISDEDSQALDDDNNGCPRRVFRDVVLLTEDRCLRLKAITNLVPTRDVPDFVKWAG